MPTILRRLPFFDHSTTCNIPGGPVVEVRHHQVVVWVSLARPEVSKLPPQVRRFPAVLDTGFNDNFLIREPQLIEWAGLRLEELQVVGHLRVEGQRVPLRDANVWLHVNRPGVRDAFADRPAFCVELDSGIAVWPTGMVGARRLPLLGLRGLHRAGLELFLDCQRCMVTARTPRRFWLFG